MKPTYVYPSRWSWLLRAVPLLFLALVLAQGVLQGVRALVGLLDRWQPLPVGDFWRLADSPLPTLLGALLALAVAGVLTLTLANLLVPLTLSEQGLYFHTLRRSPHFVPWEAVTGFFGTRVGLSTRSLLFVRIAKGAPWYSRLYGLALGAGFSPGFLVTSDLSDFGPSMAYALHALESRRGVAVSFDEQPAGAFLSMSAAPHQRLALLWPIDHNGMPLSIAPDRAALEQAGKLAVGVALSLSLVLLASGLWTLEIRWSALFFFLLALAEWPLGSYWLVAVGDLLAKSPTWPEMLALYPETQLPRWLVALLCLALVLLRAPIWLIALPLLGGLLWSGWLLSLLTARLYGTTGARSWLGSAVPIVYQMLIYVLLLYLL